MPKITSEEYRKIYDNFESRDILIAVDVFDSARHHLANQGVNTPPQIRINLLQLHELAMDLTCYGDKTKVKELFELADDLEYDLDDAISSLKKVRKIIRNLTSLCPNSIYDDYGDEEVNDSVTDSLSI